MVQIIDSNEPIDMIPFIKPVSVNVDLMANFPGSVTGSVAKFVSGANKTIKLPRLAISNIINHRNRSAQELMRTMAISNIINHRKRSAQELMRTNLPPHVST